MKLTKEQQLEIIRQRRNELLHSSDIDILKILESGSAVSDAWKKYRQDLRDLPSKVTNPSIKNSASSKNTFQLESSDFDGVTFPEKPS
jgi:hypothetical protein